MADLKHDSHVNNHICGCTNHHACDRVCGSWSSDIHIDLKVVRSSARSVDSDQTSSSLLHGQCYLLLDLSYISCWVFFTCLGCEKWHWNTNKIANHKAGWHCVSGWQSMQLTYDSCWTVGKSKAVATWTILHKQFIANLIKDEQPLRKELPLQHAYSQTKGLLASILGQTFLSLHLKFWCEGCQDQILLSTRSGQCSRSCHDREKHVSVLSWCTTCLAWFYLMPSWCFIYWSMVVYLISLGFAMLMIDLLTYSSMSLLCGPEEQVYVLHSVLPSMSPSQWLE